MNGKDSELLDIVLVLWKRKWAIIIPGLIVVIIAVAISFMLPLKWDVDAIIQPSRLLIATTAGKFEEVDVVEPRQLAGQINQDAYTTKVADELKIDIRKFPSFNAENLRDTKLVKVTVRYEDTVQALKIVTLIFNNLKIELDKKVDVEIKGIDTEIAAFENNIRQNEIRIKVCGNTINLKRLEIQDQNNAIKTKDNTIKKKNYELQTKDLDIQSKEIDKEKIKKEIESDFNKIKISEERVRSLLEEMKSVKTRIDKLDEQLRIALAQKTPTTDAVSFLLYTNEVQQNLRYYNTLDERLSLERITQENLNMGIRSKEGLIRQADNQIQQIKTQQDAIRADIANVDTEIAVIKTDIDKIANEIEVVKNDIEKISNENNPSINGIKLLQDQKGRFDYAKFIKEPTVSIHPVSPNKRAIGLVSGAFGFVIFALFVLIQEALEKRKFRSKPGS